MTKPFSGTSITGVKIEGTDAQITGSFVSAWNAVVHIITYKDQDGNTRRTECVRGEHEGAEPQRFYSVLDGD